MRIAHLLTVGLFLQAMAGAAVADQEPPLYDYDKPTAYAEFINLKGEHIGRAELIQGPHGLLIMLELENVAEGSGFHGIHIHARGDCSLPEEGFPRAGLHAHGTNGGQKHGLMHPEGPHAGDLPSIYVHDGILRYELFTTFASLDGSVGTNIMHPTRGASLIIHENPDDHYTQPVGGAGDPIACAEIKLN